MNNSNSFVVGDRSIPFYLFTCQSNVCDSCQYKTLLQRLNIMDKETLEFALIGMCAIQIIQIGDSVSKLYLCTSVDYFLSKCLTASD